MSQSLDLVRSIFADWERGEFGHATEWADPEIEFVVADGPEPGSWLGVAGVAQGARAILSPFEEARVQAVEYRELDGGRILVLVNSSGRAKKSGVELEQHVKAADLFHVRGNKVTKLVAYWDRERAFADLGLKE
jgi:ketosteroid isomerase-like protein